MIETRVSVGLGGGREKRRVKKRIVPDDGGKVFPGSVNFKRLGCEAI